MRRIEVVAGVHLRFPKRDEEFDLGVEIGALSALMALGEPCIHRSISAPCLEQLKAVAEHFRYVVVAVPNGTAFDATISPRTARPRLRLVHSGR